ncbi:hypothetical protein [Sphingobium sp. Sx8-8]|uniref:hypothetical protein n=1 Tax=Sphingobium sp. Sx8-8 TaxID=2933617 RepID=UPI001F58C91E|nr:hypothetical protein [Sphingobium sp. Sx8-8]
MRIRNIILAGTGLMLGMTAPVLASDARPPQEVPPVGAGYDDDVTAPDSPPPPEAAPVHHYEGRWSGTWRDRNGKAYSGEYEGRFEGQVHGGPGVAYDAPPHAAAPHWTSPPPAPGQPVVTTTQAPGYFANGYYYPGVTTTTVVIQPAVKTTRTYVTERVVRRRVHSK